MCQGTNVYMHNTHMCVCGCLQICPAPLATTITCVFYFQLPSSTSTATLEPGAREKQSFFCKPSSTQEHVGSIEYYSIPTNNVKDFTINIS